MTKKRTAYKVIAHREPGWWIIQVPELDVTTQARRMTEIEANAREAIGVWLDVDPSTIKVAITTEAPEVLDQLAAARDKAAAAQEDAREASKDIASAIAILIGYLGLSYREAGSLTGLSHQRVAQLAHEAKATTTAKRPRTKAS